MPAGQIIAQLIVFTYTCVSRSKARKGWGNAGAAVPMQGVSVQRCLDEHTCDSRNVSNQSPASTSPPVPSPASGTFNGGVQLLIVAGCCFPACYQTCKVC